MFSNNSNKTAILPRFELDFPNRTHVFSNHYNRVKGKVELQFVAEASDITAITVGFKGDCTLIQSQSGDEHASDKKKSKKDDKNSLANPRDTKSETLFQYSTTVFNSKNPVDFPEGYVLEYPLDYKLPVDEKPLPSSCESFVLESGVLKGNFFATYELFVKIEYLHSKIRKDPTYIEFLCPIKFQALTVSQDSESLFVDPITTVSDSYVYQNKRKMFLPDHILGGVISAKSHGGPAKFKKKYWGSLFSGETETTKDIPLKLSLDIPSSFDFDRPIGDLPLRIESNQEKFTIEDLGYNGMSTKLGFFEIESISVSLLQSVSMTVTEKTPPLYNIVSTPLFEEKKFGGNRPVIDLYKFKYDPETKTHYLNTNLNHFLQQDTTLFQKLKHPIINKIKLGDLFSCQNTIKIDISVGTGQQQLGRSTMNKKDTNVFSFIKQDVIFEMSFDPSFASSASSGNGNQLEPPSYSAATDPTTNGTGTSTGKTPRPSASAASLQLPFGGTTHTMPKSYSLCGSINEQLFKVRPVVYTASSLFYSRWYDVSTHSVKVLNYNGFGFSGGVRNSNNDHWAIASTVAFGLA
ncbi:unnamed protein product [Ambrosiozyma monospora]|uniref:Unnamed protein product n=1 Tax=Ambrosiozyma monospora TaxID=43982 RepID=A0A9W6YZW5_AMBMO|nr:unnamed protein product [Ambrosiozyma monospora]